MQRIYMWHRSFAIKAIKSVKWFWESNPLFVDPEEWAAYIQWAIPKDKTVHVLAIYKDVNKSDMANPVS